MKSSTGDDCCDLGAALRMAGHDQRQQPRKVRTQPLMNLDHHLFFARVGRGGGQNRAPRERGRELVALVVVDRKRRHVELEIADDRHMRRTEVAVTPGVVARAYQTQIEALQQCADQTGHEAPALIRALRQPTVDQDQRNSALPARHDQVRPEIGFDEQREAWTPMVEKARHVARHVERNKLVDHLRGKPLTGDSSRGHGTGGDEQRKSAFSDALDQRNRRDEFADACTMHPHQRAVRARYFAFAAPLG